MMSHIILAQLSEFDAVLVAALARSLEQTFRREVRVRKLIRPLDSAYDPYRNQFSSPRLLLRLRRVKKDPDDKILGITDVDLYSPGYDFIFGEAELATGVATLSISRLHLARQGKRAEEILRQRTIKEAVHELGHLYGLGHCRSRRCVMRSCTSVAHVDRKQSVYCPNCLTQLQGR